MSKHISISPTEVADRLAICELVEAYAHCADRRDAKGQMALFTDDTHFVVYMNAQDPKPSQELNSREALAPVFADLNQYVATMHFVGQSTILSLTPDRGSGETYCLAHHLTVDGAKRKLMIAAPLRRHIREAERRMVVCRAPPVCELDRRANSVMTANDHTASRSPMSVPTVGQQRLVILGASGMVGGYALRYALDSPAVKSVISVGRKKLRISHPKLKEVVHQNFALPWKSMLQSTSAESLLRSVLRSGRH